MGENVLILLFAHFLFISYEDFDRKWLVEEMQKRLTGNIARGKAEERVQDCRKHWATQAEKARAEDFQSDRQ